ncbi:MAG: ubiquitin-like domain-containing protein, partial [Candidatus Saccharimonadales bacterium]
MREKLLKFRLKAERYRRIRIRRRIKKAKKASRHPYAVPVITISSLALLSGIGVLIFFNLNRTPAPQSYVVIVSHDNAQQIVPSIEPTVGALLKKMHLTLARGDVVEPSLSTPIKQDDFRVNIYRALPVEIVDGNNKVFTFSAATTGRAIASQVGVSLYPEDIASIDPVRNFYRQGAVGEQVVVKRAIAVNVDLYGTNVVLRTQAKTIAALIKEKGIHVIKGDKIVPAPDTPIAAGEQVSFIRTGIK